MGASWGRNWEQPLGPTLRSLSVLALLGCASERAARPRLDQCASTSQVSAASSARTATSSAAASQSVAAKAALPQPTLANGSNAAIITTMDVPIYLPVWAGLVGPVGYLRRGAEVRCPLGCQAYRPWQQRASDPSPSSEYLQVDVAFPAPPHAVLSNLDLKRGDAYVFSSTVIVPKLAVPEALTRLGAPETTDWGYFRTLYARPASMAFSMVLCGRARKLDSRNGYSFVAAEYPEGELWGWLKEGSLDTPEADRSHDLSCSSPIRNGAPEDYRRPMDAEFKAAPLERRIHVGDELFFLHRAGGSNETVVCQKVRIAKAVRTPDLLAQYLREDGTIEETHFFARAGIRLGVGSDQLTSDGTLRFNSSGVGDHLRAVTEDGTSIGFVRFGDSKEEDKGVIRAYRTTSVEWWDRSAEKCAERLKTLQETTASLAPQR